MAASNEWEKWHLTPDGWVKGTEKTDFSRKEVVPPRSRVATYKYQEYVGNVHSKMQISWDQVWAKDSTSTQDLKDQYGEYPSTYIEDRVKGKPIEF